MRFFTHWSDVFASIEAQDVLWVVSIHAVHTIYWHHISNWLLSALCCAIFEVFRIEYLLVTF